MFDIVVLTDERYVNPAIRNDYINNVLREDRLVLDALQSIGLNAVKVAWSDPTFDWRNTKYVLFRTTWDYAERFDEFSKWLDQVSEKTTCLNSYDLIHWNLDKHYLNDLKQKGVNVVETYFIEPGDPRSLHELHRELGWEQTVLKPAISAAAKDTFKLDLTNLSEHEDRYRALIANESMLLQPFQDSVVERGELSLMVVGGQYTHTVIKKAKPGDFRVQDDFGGTVHVYEPTEEEKELALKAFHACPEIPIYARVDMINDNNGNPAISELELIEPEMWFRNKPKAAAELAEIIIKSFDF